MWPRVEQPMQRALINGAVGLVSMRDGRPFGVMALTITDGRIAEIDILADRERLAGLHLAISEDRSSDSDR